LVLRGERREGKLTASSMSRVLYAKTKLILKTFFQFSSSQLKTEDGLEGFAWRKWEVLWRNPS
jgi:hypothetical protein